MWKDEYLLGVDIIDQESIEITMRITENIYGETLQQIRNEKTEGAQNNE